VAPEDDEARGPALQLAAFNTDGGCQHAEAVFADRQRCIRL